jgi:hypothetical protein
VRQDFVVLGKPGRASVPASRLGRSLALPTDGELRLELAVSGAKVEPTADGAQPVLAPSGRKIAYGRLRATDATGKALPARMEVAGRAGSPLPAAAGGRTSTGAQRSARPTLAVLVCCL